jgi:XisH protein
MARDKYHEAVRRALEKDGWKITHDPLLVPTGGPTQFFLIDLGAEQLLAAELNGQKIAVEVKVFGGLSLLHEFHAALGQYLNYKLALERTDASRQLFLAIPRDTFERFERATFPLESIQHYGISLVVYEPSEEVIVSWNPMNK